MFGELVPKRIALQKSYEWAKMACGVIRGMAFVLRPVIWLLSVSVNGVLRLLHMKVEAEEENVTEDEIRMMVDLGGEKGAIDEDEQEWIQNVFDFGDSSVRESMTPRSDMDALDIESTDGEILEMIQETGRSRFPVYEESVDTILGILNVRDYLLDRNAGKNTALKDLLRPAYFVPETMKADNLFKEMQKEKVHIAVVVDEYGGTEGIITMEDLLEEIVGNIYDEFDKAEQPEIVPWARTSGASRAPRPSAPWWTTWSCPCRKATTTTPWAALSSPGSTPSPRTASSSTWRLTAWPCTLRR